MSTRTAAQGKGKSAETVTLGKSSAKSPRHDPATRPSAASTSSNKISRVLRYLQRANGATLSQLMAFTGWQAHSVRAVICGLRKEGISIVRSREKGRQSVYRAGKA